MAPLSIHHGSGAAYSDTVGFGLGIQQRRKLRMATGAPLINNLLPSRVRATSAHTSCSIIASARSMPVVIPAEVHTGPSMMRIRSSSTSLLGTEPASHLRGASARSRDGHGADLLQPARTRRRTVEATGRDRSKAWHRNLIKPVSTMRSRRSRQQSVCRNSDCRTALSRRWRRSSFWWSRQSWTADARDRPARPSTNREFEDGGRTDAHHLKTGQNDKTDTLHGRFCASVPKRGLNDP
jgi:hypothetical protein